MWDEWDEWKRSEGESGTRNPNIDGHVSLAVLIQLKVSESTCLELGSSLGHFYDLSFTSRYLVFC